MKRLAIAASVVPGLSSAAQNVATVNGQSITTTV